MRRYISPTFNDAQKWIRNALGHEEEHDGVESVGSSVLENEGKREAELNQSTVVERQSWDPLMGENLQCTPT